MKKRNLAAIFTILLVIGVLLIPACNNIFSPSMHKAAEEGNVIVSFSAGRAALSPSETAFDVYEFIFRRNGIDVGLRYEKNKNEALAFTIPVGNYTLDVNAYIDSPSAENLAAFGTSAPFTVSPAAVSVTVGLRGNAEQGRGTFSYTIQIPENGEITEFVLLDSNDIPIALGAAVTGENGVLSGSAEVSAGWHFVILRMGKEADGREMEAGYANGVLIYANNTTYFGTENDPFALGDNYFGIVGGNDTMRVYEWHGFDILTNPSDGKYPEWWYSKGIGTQYQSIELPDNDGNIKTYRDVLKVEPPANADPGFYEGVVLSYKTMENATYRFEMEMWYEMPPGKIPGGTLPQEGAGTDGYITWQHWNTPLTWPWESWTTGEWLPVCFEVTNSGMSVNPNDLWNAAQGQIVYLQGNYKNGDEWANDGLLYGTAYIRDVKVTRITGGVEVVEHESYLNGRTPPKPLWVSHERATLAPGEFRFFDGSMASKGMIWVTTYPNTNVTCSSDNPEIASVEYYTEGGLAANWKINAHAVGETTIRLSHISGQTAEVAIKVEEPRDKNAEKKYVVLTFDDGPFSGLTESILDTLKENGAAATFYLVGNRVNERPDIVRRMREEGHGIGNHTMTHYSQGYRWDEQEYADWEYTEGQNTINSVVSPGTFIEGYHRQPTATYNPMIVKAARDAGKALMGAGEICFDWRGFDGDYLSSTIQTLARPWGIINMHDFNGGTAVAVSKFVPAMVADGWVFVTIEEMIAAKRAKELEPGYIYEYFGDDLEVDPAFDMSKLNVKGVLLSHDTVSLTAGDSKAVKATVLPRVANNLNVTWSTSDPAVATVENGVITATGGGTAIVTATTAEGGKTASVTVNVIGSTQNGTYTTWNTFNYAGWDGYLSSYASGEVLLDYRPGDGYSYSNVLKLIPPDGGYKNDPARGYGASAMTFTVPDAGTYTISMDVWVETDQSVIDMVWVENRNWQLFNPRGGITAGYNHISGTQYVEAGSVIGLIAYSGDGSIRLKDATIYFKNLKLERVSAAAPVIDIQSTATEGGPVNPNLPKKVTEWNGFDVLTDPADGKYYPGWYARALGTEYSSVTVPGDNASSCNVLRLTPLYSAYEGVLLIYPTPENATYEFSMKMWVDGNPGEVINWQYYYAPGGGGHPSFTYQSVPTNGWVTLQWQFTNTGINNPELMIGGEQNPQGQLVYLQAGNGGMKYTAYIKDVVVKKNGVVISDSNAVPEGGVTLKWADNGVQLTAQVSSGYLINSNPLTVKKGGAVTITPEGSYVNYEWLVGRDVVGRGSSYTFTATAVGDHKILLWVNDYEKGASISIKVVE